MKKIISVFCSIALVLSIVLPTLPSVIFAAANEELTLSDGTKWLANFDENYNTLNTDGEGRYTISTTAANSANSAFSILSASVYPLSTSYQLMCREAANANTYFGLTTEYSLEMKSENSIKFIRKNGSPSENAVKIYVTIGGTSHCILTTAANYTRTRVSTIAVTKKDGGWYMTWNGTVLNGDGCSDEVKEYCKLENHFPAEALSADLPMHFYASSSKMLATNGFSLKPDRCISDGVLTVAPDSYSDANNPNSLTKSNVPTYEYDSERGTYKLNFTSNKTKAAVMAPITVFDAENGESDIFNIEPYLFEHNINSQQWVEYSFSNDPTFSDGTEIKFKTVRLAGSQGTHMLYDNELGQSVTCSAANNNFFNDPYNSVKKWQFRTDNATGKVFLYIWGANLAADNAPLKISNNFTSLTDAPIYVSVYMYNIGTAKVSIDVTPYNGMDAQQLIAVAEETALKTPTSLKDAEEIVSTYDLNAYRLAISEAGLSNILATRMYMYAEREKALKARIEALEGRIVALPEADELATVYNENIKHEICDTYLEFADLGEHKGRIDALYIEKLDSLINALTLIDTEFAQMKSLAENFGVKVNEIGEPNDITVYNFTEKKLAITELSDTYEQMSEFIKSLISSAALEKLQVLEDRIQEVCVAYDVFVLINQLPTPENVQVSDENAILEVRKAYNLLEEPELINSVLVEKLTKCEVQLEAVKIRDLDWYSKNSAVKYTGNNFDSYTFESTANKVSGNTFATTTDTYNMKNNKLYWLGMGCGSGQFALLGLTSTVKGQQVSQTSADNFVFVLRPGAGNAMYVTFFDINGESERVATLNGFDLSVMHIFEFEEGEDGHWYLVIDGTVCDKFHYDRFDSYMEQYGESTYLSIGGNNGFSANNICIKDKNASTDTKEWAFSLPFGCDSEGDDLVGTVNLKRGAQAITKKKYEDIYNYEFVVNMNLQQVKNTNTVIGILAEPDGFSNYKSSYDKGVVLRIYNRPSTFPNQAHINVQFPDGTSKTHGFIPVLDTSYISVSIEKGVDNHYYMRLKWDGGSWLVKYDRSDANYRNVHLDNIVENGGYFMIGTSSSDLSANYNLVYSDKSAEDGFSDDTVAVTSFILEFEKYFDKLNSRNKEAYEYMSKKWSEINFLTRNSVIADLMDDEAAYNLLLTVMEYKDGDLDEYYTVVEEVYVTNTELDALIEQYSQDDTADYKIINSENGEVIHTIKNLSAKRAFNKHNLINEKTQSGSKNDYEDIAIIVLSSVALIMGIFLIIANKKRIIDFIKH